MMAQRQFGPIRRVSFACGHRVQVELPPTYTADDIDEYIRKAETSGECLGCSLGYWKKGR